VHAGPVERLARPQHQPGQVERDDAGNAFLELIGRKRHHVADQHLVRVGRPARQHLHAVEGDPAIVLGGHPQRGLRQALGKIIVPVARRLRRNDRIGGKQFVAPDVLIDRHEIAAAAAGRAVEHLRLHR